MAPGTTERDIPDRRRVVQRDLRSSLKDISAMLPIPDTVNGGGLTKKETLSNVLSYLDFLQKHIEKLQTRLPTRCQPHFRALGGYNINENMLSDLPPEPSTPWRVLKTRHKRTCGRPRKRLLLSTELWADVQNKRRRLFRAKSNDNVSETEEAAETVAMPHLEWPEPHTINKGEGPVLDSDSLPSSIDSELSRLVTQTAPSGGCRAHKKLKLPWEVDHCSVCEDQTGSEEGSPGSGLLDSPLAGTLALLLNDHMLGSVPTQGDSDLPLSLGSQVPLSGARESLNLSPSLLTSPARGLTHPLLPEGQEELQALFEDVWVTPKAPKGSTLTSYPSADTVSKLGAPDWLSSQSEDEDLTWTPKRSGTLRKRRHVSSKQRSSPRRRLPSHPSLKKKCVNGFIMFCRINRKVYLSSSHPGTPSTVVTKELANLWHVMPKQERRVYCAMARRFSCQQNRNVKMEREMAVEGDEGIPSPLYMLLAQRDMCAARDRL